MRVVIQQPQFLPWAGYWHKVASADILVLYSGVQYVRRSHYSRVKIDGGTLILPVQSHPQSALIRDIRLVPGELPKLAKRIRQSLMGKKNPYGDRLETLVWVMEKDPWSSYSAAMEGLHNLTAAALGLVIPLTHMYTVEGTTAKDKMEYCLRALFPGRVTLLNGRSGVGMGYGEIPQVAQVLTQYLEPDTPDCSVLQLIARERCPLDVVMSYGSWR